MNGIWTRTNSGQATRHIQIQTWGCFLKYDVGNGWDASANSGAGAYRTATPNGTSWLRVMGGYVWGPWEYDTGEIHGSGGTEVRWSTGPKWTRGAHHHQCTVVLYQHVFEGKESKTFDVGDYNKDAMKSKNTNNDDVTSVKVGPGCKVYLYEHDSFNGKNVVLGAGSHSSLGGFPNDAVSSLKVRKA